MEPGEICRRYRSPRSGCGCGSGRAAALPARPRPGRRQNCAVAGSSSPKWTALTPASRFSRGIPSLILSAVTSITFGTDGWRGVIAEDFTFANLRKVAYAIARYIVRAEQPSRGVLVGYDTRYASERAAGVAAETVAMTGVPVWLSDAPCPSPALSLLVRQRGAAGGIMITASHNPYRWNGVKFKASYGSSPLPSIVAQIETELEVVLGNGIPALPPRGDLVHSLGVRSEEHTSELQSRLHLVCRLLLEKKKKQQHR